MIYKLIFSKQAAEDLDNTFEYIAAALKSPIAANNLMQRIDKSINLHKEQPFMHTVFSDEVLKEMGYRKLTVENYVVIYLVDEDRHTITIVRIFYSGRNYVTYIK
jgi:toxin ParE1/3/4